MQKYIFLECTFPHDLACQECNTHCTRTIVVLNTMAEAYFMKGQQTAISGQQAALLDFLFHKAQKISAEISRQWQRAGTNR